MLGQNLGIHNNLPFWIQFFLIFILLKFAVPLDAVDPSEPFNKWTIVCNEEKTKCYDALVGDDGKSKPTKRFNIGAQDCGEEIEEEKNWEANEIFDMSNINSGEGKFLTDSVKNNAIFCRKPSADRSERNGTKGTASTMMDASTSTTAKCLLSFTMLLEI